MRKRVERLCIVLILLVVFVNLFRCTSQNIYQETEEKYIVGVVAKSESSEFWMLVRSGMEAAAAKFHMEIVFLAPDSELKQDLQEKMVERLLERDIDALAISPINSYEIPAYMEQIETLEMPVVTFDTGFDGKSFPYIGVNNDEIGYRLAKILAEEIGHSGEVGIVAGSLVQMGHRERVEGFLRYMETESDINIVFIENGYDNLQMTEKKVQKLLKKYPNIKGIFATSAVTAMGLIDAIEDQEIKIATVDEQKDALNALEDGTLVALASQKGYEIGYETIRLLEKMRTEDIGQQDFIVETEILTQENVTEYRRKYEAKEYPE